MQLRIPSAAALAVATTLVATGAFAQAKADAPKADAKPAAKAEAKAGGATCVARMAAGDKLKARLTTSMGPIVLELDKAKAPVSVENFAKYIDSGFYNGTIFHRVIDGFMIQGGGFTKDMQQKPTQAAIKNEAANGLKNDAYTISMARTMVRDSATSQFFINVKNNDMLNYSGEAPQGWGYAVFGRVVEGETTVDKIRQVATAPAGGGHQNVPTTPVVIEKAECL